MVRVTVYHDGRFWVLLAEREEEGRLRAVRRVYGAEPPEPEVRRVASWAIREGLDRCVSVETSEPPLAGGFKRRLREARADRPPCGSRSREALQAQRERELLDRRRKRAETEEEGRRRRFEDRHRRKDLRRRGRA